ncbi:MAG: hypothetical protein C0596_10840 [Marinilabiliales bacterium]|nr:MAG: hypothetical protein C0596_10840 [Marinilabiliales bacterium]
MNLKHEIMKKKAIILSIILAFCYSFVWAQSATYRQVNEEGISNLVFANQSISKGEESKFTLKETFDADETIYARAYFPQAISSYGLASNEKIIVVAYIDGKQVDRVYITPKPEWDQMLVYVMNTGDDDFSRLANELYYIDSGTHTLTISVGLQRYGYMETVIKDDGTITKHKVDKVVVISQSDIEINVE